ncbi:MHYT domain-containing protein [Roseibium aestuarii]|uniref:MHYT domain-containing protein n=1 Tax=Roseibium aestuarii TaxID=2600299 RepID=A0ABW4JXI1_9HYPH|nr:MHYT domain-containing protein [Roseibium aestuarii]
MMVAHEPWLVALSLIVAFQGSFVGLSLAVQVVDASRTRRRFLLASAALTLALAIWSMHFVGMLAARLPVAIDFLVLPTLLSFLVCVLVVGVAVLAASNGRLTHLRLGSSALVMGAGICIMHYLGMYALHGSTRMTHDPALVLTAFVVAFNAAGLALWLSFGTGRRPPLVVSAVVQALAVAAMHYTAMAGMEITALPDATASDAALATAPAVGAGTLAIIVACVAFLVSGLFLLTLVPAQDEAEEAAVDAATPAELSEEMTAPAEPPSAAREAVATRGSAGLQAAPTQRSGTGAIRHALPVERDGMKGQISPLELVAIQADAHYTQLHDGQRTIFCPLNITEVEAKLDPRHFSRVHRSHIVNMDRVTGCRRVGDAGLLIMATADNLQVPVSRARWSHVKARLARQGQDRKQGQGQGKETPPAPSAPAAADPARTPLRDPAPARQELEPQTPLAVSSAAE